MKNIIMIFILVASQATNAQLAIGSEKADTSSILDLTASSKGLLVPRMTSIQRDAIVLPALGLLIYNTDDSDYNSYNGAVLGWQDFSTPYKSVNATGDISTSSNVATTATGMTIIPKTGTYSVLFNSQYKNTPTYTIIPGTPSTVTTILADLNLFIADLDKYFVLGTPEYNSIGHTHYANGVNDGNPISNDMQANYANLLKHIYPGAYYEGAAINFVIDAVVTLDGMGDPNAKFIFNADAAINTGIGVKFKLINEAKACNVFWLANGGMSIGATNQAVGNWVSRAGAIACGIDTDLDGRMLTSAGALAMGSGTLKVPTGTTFMNLRSLVSFLGYTGAGAINITDGPAPNKTIIIGDLFTCESFGNFGVAGAFPGPFPAGPTVVGTNNVILTGNLYNCSGPDIIGTGSTTLTENNIGSLGTFSIYKNSVEIPEATKTIKTDSTASSITLQTIVAGLNGTDVIDVRWKTAAGNTLMMGNRNLTLIKVQ